MKILSTCYDFLPNVGGVSNCAASILKAISRGNEVRVITRADAPSMPFEVIPTSHHTNTTIAAIKMTKAVFSEVKKKRPDACFHFLWWPCAFSSFILSFFPKRAVPYFIMVHGKEILENKYLFKGKVRHWLKRAIFSRASGVICVSDFTAMITMNHAPSIQCKVKTIYHGVDTDEFTPAMDSIELRKRYGLEGKKIFLTVARLESYKGIDFGIQALKEALKANSELAYVVVGTGEDEERLKKMVLQENLEKSVVFAGKVPYSELADHYRMADCFLLLTRNEMEEPNFEGFGISILEAGACGKPALVGDHSGMIEAIQHGSLGWSVDPINIPAISTAMLKIMGDSQERSRKGQLARKAAEGYFNWPRTAAEIVEFLKKESDPCVE